MNVSFDFRLLVLALVAGSLFILPALSHAAPGTACTSIEQCASSGEGCFQNVCRTTCTNNANACTGGTTCQPWGSGTTVKVCLPGDSSPTFTCDPACRSDQTCTFINSLAQGRCVNNASPAGGTFANPLKASSLSELLTAVLHGVVRLGAILLVLALVWVGFLFVAAQGAEEKIRDARNALFWTVVGGLILLGAEAISLVIGSTVNAL